MNSKDILEKYPKIFKEYFECGIDESCMAWGLEVPQHWLPVIDWMCYSMQYLPVIGYKTYYPEEPPQVIATDVKEKFGGLRFYYRLKYEADEVPGIVQERYHGLVDGIILMGECTINHMEVNGKYTCPTCQKMSSIIDKSANRLGELVMEVEKVTAEADRLKTIMHGGV